MAFEEELDLKLDSEAEKILTVEMQLSLSKEKQIKSFNDLTKRWGNDNIILLSGAGKTTLVKLLSQKENLRFLFHTQQEVQELTRNRTRIISLLMSLSSRG